MSIVNCYHTNEKRIGQRVVEGVMYYFIRCNKCRTVRREQV